MGPAGIKAPVAVSSGKETAPKALVPAQSLVERRPVISRGMERRKAASGPGPDMVCVNAESTALPRLAAARLVAACSCDRESGWNAARNASCLSPGAWQTRCCRLPQFRITCEEQPFHFVAAIEERIHRCLELTGHTSNRFAVRSVGYRSGHRYAKVRCRKSS